jgi:hypothetical protein
MLSSAPPLDPRRRARSGPLRTVTRVAWRIMRGVLVVVGAMVAPFAMPPPPPPPRPVPEKTDGGEPEAER